MLTDILGKPVFSLQGDIPALNQKLKSTTGQLPAGAYFLQLKDNKGNGRQTVKMVKVK
jgi:hypothetical protein